MIGEWSVLGQEERMGSGVEESSGSLDSCKLNPLHSASKFVISDIITVYIC